jgi:hypothetical protein
VVKGSNVRVPLERRDQGEWDNESSTGSHNAFRDSISSTVDRDTKGRVCREARGQAESTLKRLGVNSIPGIEEVNLFNPDGTVTHFANPKGQYPFHHWQ